DTLLWRVVSHPQARRHNSAGRTPARLEELFGLWPWLLPLPAPQGMAAASRGVRLSSHRSFQHHSFCQCLAFNKTASLMNASAIDLTSLLKAIALLQLGVAVLNLFLVRLFNWRDDLLRVPLLLREVFQVHAWFISITLTVFAVMTWRFAQEFAGRAD